MQLASYLEGIPLMWMMLLNLHVNLNADDDDDESCRKKISIWNPRHMAVLKRNLCYIETCYNEFVL